MRCIRTIAVAVCCLALRPGSALSQEARYPNRVAALEPASGSLVLVRDG